MGKVRIEKIEDRIWLKGSWEDAGPTRAKKIRGASWRREDKVWSYPLTLEACRALRTEFGDQLAIGPELNRWAWQAVEHEKKMNELGRQMDAEVDLVPELAPILAKAMDSRTYQRSGARFIADGKRVLLADEPSLGKTATALAGIMEAGAWHGSHLVVAPKTSLVSTWARQVTEWTDAEAHPMPEGKAAREKALEEFLASPARSKFLIVNPAMMRIVMDEWCEACDAWIAGDKTDDPKHAWYQHKTTQSIRKCDWPDIISHQWTSAIVDECHEHFSQYRPSNVTQTMEGLARIQPDIRIALTGTPLRGHEKKLWGTLRWLGVVKSARLHQGYWNWIEEWMDVDKDGFGWNIIGLKEERREEFYRHIDTYTRRLTKKEARPDLPDKNYIPIWVTMSGKHKRQHDKFLAEGELTLSGGTVSSIGTLSELTRLRQFAFGSWEFDGTKMHPTGESPKVEWLIQALRERGVTGKDADDWLPEDEGAGFKYVVASQFTEVVDATERALAAKGIKTLKITGAVTGKKRDKVVERFQSSDTEYRVLLINTKTGGVSIDLDAWCDEMFIFDETWVADDQAQLEGRIDNRTGRSAARTFYYVRTLGTIEEEIAEGNYSQDEMQKELLDGRRGVNLALRIIRNIKES